MCIYINVDQEKEFKLIHENRFTVITYHVLPCFSFVDLENQVNQTQETAEVPWVKGQSMIDSPNLNLAAQASV